MTAAVPDVTSNAGVFHAGVEPGASVETGLAAFARGNRIGRMLPWTPERFEGSDSVGVQMDRSRRPILGFG
jgi:hypothetical protein